MDDLLARMAKSSADRARATGTRSSVRDLRSRIASLPPAPTLRLHPSGFDLIAEIKPRAPSGARLLPPGGVTPARVRRLVRAYADGGAAAVSVLTEPSAFGGDLSHLRAAAEAVAVPAMRKDFLVDPFQIAEARAAGAGGVLLMVKILGSGALGRMLETCADLGLFALVETFDERDIEKALAVLDARCLRAGPPVLLGVNARDLRTLAVDMDRIERLVALLPPGLPRVAESGLARPDDAARVASLGYGVALVGSALMRSADPRSLVAGMIEAGRAAKAPPEGGAGRCACS